MTMQFLSTDLPEITAEVHSDDYAFEVSFLANRWFASASPDDICKLAKTLSRFWLPVSNLLRDYWQQGG